MASSTTRPIAKIIASNVKVLMENPRKYIAVKVPTKEIGIVTSGIRVILAEARKI